MRERQPSLGFGNVLRSEWTKLRSVRSTFWTLGATVLLCVGFAALACWGYADHINGLSSTERARELAGDQFDAVSWSLVGINLGQLALGVLGVLVVTSEYGSGLIRTTLGAVPRRVPLLLAKSVMFGVAALIAGQLIAFGSFFLGQSLLADASLDASLGDDGVLRAITSGGLYLALVGLIGLGLGTIIRHTAGAISALVAFLLVLPVLSTALPGAWESRVGERLPMSIMETLVSSGPPTGDNALSASSGMLLMVGYAAAAVVIGAVLLVRRDA